MKTIASILILGLLSASLLSGCTGEPTTEGAPRVADGTADTEQDRQDTPTYRPDAGSEALNDTATNATPLPQVRSIAMTAEVPNFYHELFRRPNWTAHPAEYIPGYPEDALPLNLTLDAETFDDALEADEALWTSLEQDQIYYIPGTAFLYVRYASPSPMDTDYIATDGDHGGGVAAHLLHGAGDRDALGLAVPIMYLLHEIIDITHAEPFIDFLSTSFAVPASTPAPTLFGEYESYRMVEEGGKIMVSGVPNGRYSAACGAVTPHFLCAIHGPSWVVAVGRYTTHPMEHIDGRGPIDIAASNHQCPRGKTLHELRACSGTSFSTPNVVGLMSRILSDLRAEWGWNECGRDLACAPDGANLPAAGHLADGRLDREELLDAVYRTASTAKRGLAPEYNDVGWGVIDPSTIDKAWEVLWDRAEPEDRPEVEWWWTQHHESRRTYWEPWIPIWEQQHAQCQSLEWPC